MQTRPFALFQRLDILAVEVATQLVVVILARRLDDGMDLLGIDAEKLQHVLRQHHARLQRLGQHQRCARLLQRLHAGVAAGAHQNRQIAVLGPHGTDDALGRMGLIDGDDHQPRPLQTGRAQHVDMTGVAEEHLLARLPRLLDQPGIGVQRHMIDPLPQQESGHVLTDPAIATEDHMPLLLAHRLAETGPLGHMLPRHLAGEQPPDDPAIGADQQRRNHHAEDDGRQHRLRLDRRQQVVGDGQRYQGETEFATIGEHDAGTRRDRFFMAEDTDDQRHQHRLADDDAEREHGDQRPPRPRLDQIELGADADEENAHEDVAKRSHIDFDLVLELRFTEHHAGQKGAEGQ